MRHHLHSAKILVRKLGFTRLERQNKSRKIHRRLHFEHCEDRRMLATFTVTEIYDAIVTGPNDAPGTLGQAVFDAEFLEGPDIIVFDPSLEGARITLGKDANGNSIATGELSVNAIRGHPTFSRERKDLADSA